MGAKTAQNSKKWHSKFPTLLPKSGSGYEPAFQDYSRAFWPRFLGGQGSMFDDFGMMFELFGLLWACFRLLFLALVSVFLVRSSTNFAKNIQEPAEHKAENPRTCRGQSREENPYERLHENSSLQAFFFQTPFLIARVQTPKTLGGGTPPQGASLRRPTGSACGIRTRVLRILPPILLLDSSSRRFLSSPS